MLDEEGFLSVSNDKSYFIKTFKYKQVGKKWDNKDKGKTEQKSSGRWTARCDRIPYPIHY